MVQERLNDANLALFRLISLANHCYNQSFYLETCLEVASDYQNLINSILNYTLK